MSWGQDLWSFVWSLFMIIIFISYLFVLFSILSDLFRDHSVKGGVKALWIIFLIFFPFITAIVYLIARGSGMGARAQAYAMEQKKAADDYIREVASSPADQVAKLHELREKGAITEAEYEAMKAKALEG